MYQPAIKDLILFHGMKEVLDELKRLRNCSHIIELRRAHSGILHNNDIENIQEVYCSKNLFGKDKMIKRFLKSKDNGERYVIRR